MITSEPEDMPKPPAPTAYVARKIRSSFTKARLDIEEIRSRLMKETNDELQKLLQKRPGQLMRVQVGAALPPLYDLLIHTKMPIRTPRIRTTQL